MMKRIALPTLCAIFVALFVLYLTDWLLLRTKIGRGTATGTVQVNEYLSTPLKGNKAEYDYLGSVAQSCTHSIFQHTSDPPCWWVERHKDHWE